MKKELAQLKTKHFKQIIFKSVNLWVFVNSKGKKHEEISAIDKSKTRKHRYITWTIFTLPEFIYKSDVPATVRERQRKGEN